MKFHSKPLSIFFLNYKYLKTPPTPEPTPLSTPQNSATSHSLPPPNHTEKTTPPRPLSCCSGHRNKGPKAPVTQTHHHRAIEPSSLSRKNRTYPYERRKQTQSERRSESGAAYISALAPAQHCMPAGWLSLCSSSSSLAAEQQGRQWPVGSRLRWTLARETICWPRLSPLSAVLCCNVVCDVK